jgi:hypothetical protein
MFPGKLLSTTLEKSTKKAAYKQEKELPSEPDDAMQ